MSWNSQYPSKQPPKSILRSKSSRYQFQRKHVVKSNTEKVEDEELLMFGYACKLFPPDDHSRDIFKGHHLIPWNGDEKLQLMIDRYDARASLHDLSDFDGDSWNTQYDISEEEERIEQLCDQERYMAMYTDIAEEKLRHEEELKRLHASIEGGNTFNQVGFNYDTSTDDQSNEVTKATGPTKPEGEGETMVEEEKPFLAPASLAIPPHMEIPPTEKMHAIIEKTATFVSKQGVQMEIILKAKQANSSQFLFLDFDHYLNPYYKHVLKRIKEGKYKPVAKTEEKEDDEEEDESDSDEDGGYLHPSLFANAQRNKQQEEEEKEKYKAIRKVDPNHPLAKLIEKGKKANALRQYNLMKLATQNYSADKENALEPPPLPKFMENESRNSSAASSPLSLGDQIQDALPRSITPQQAAMVIVPPPPDIQPMVDSVAKQIAEEGDAVEQSMREREDPLLVFLEPSHELHPYYTFRKTFIREQTKARKRMLQQAQELAAAEEQMKQSIPISFSIKGKDVVPKTTLISTRLQLLEGESDHEESTNADTKTDDKSEDQLPDGNKESSAKSKEKSKRKFVEISVVEGIKPKPAPETPAPTPMTLEDKTRLLEQTKRKFTDAPPILPIPTPSISNFTVVTPDGNTMSIAEFREKQQERRQKAAQLAMDKAKMATIVPVLEPEPQKKDPASEDIFGSSDEEEEEKAEEVKPIMDAPSVTAEKPSKTEKPSKPRSPSIERKSSSPLSTAKPARTLKDLIAEASRSSTPSKDSKRHRSKSRSRDRSRSRSHSRTSSPPRRTKTRSESRERDFVSSSYKKLLGSSSSRYSKYHDNANIPSAYKLENPSYSYGNVSHSRYSRRERDRDFSPVRHSRKRYRHSPERDGSKKKHRSNSSSSHKSKRKHSKSQKKNKKKKSKTKKKRRRKNSSSDEDSQSSDSDSDSSDSDKNKRSNGKPLSISKETVVKEEGECSPSSSQDANT